jgi:hypothetical protein
MDAETLAASVRADRRTARLLAHYAATVPDRERLTAYMRHVVAQHGRTAAARCGEPPPSRGAVLGAAEALERELAP